MNWGVAFDDLKYSHASLCRNRTFFNTKFKSCVQQPLPKQKWRNNLNKHELPCGNNTFFKLNMLFKGDITINSNAQKSAYVNWNIKFELIVVKKLWDFRFGIIDPKKDVCKKGLTWGQKKLLSVCWKVKLSWLFLKNLATGICKHAYWVIMYDSNF